jgi:hypothetical protein
LKLIDKIDGIIKTEINQYKIKLHKTESYSWEEILPSATKIIENYNEDENFILDLMLFPVKLVCGIFESFVK